MDEISTENELLLIKDLCARAPYHTKVSVGMLCES